MGTPRVHVSIDRVRAFCEKWGVREFSLFGSVLTDEFGPESDVDVLLEFAPGRGFTFENTPLIEDDLRALFPGRRVDAVEKDLLRNPLRRRHILAHREVIHAA